MSKYLCLFPTDKTTEFLRPVYEQLCRAENIVGLDGDTVDEDYFLENLEIKLKETEGLIFFGHGTRATLYGTNLNPLVDEVNDNVKLLNGKKLCLFSCLSSDFIKNHKLHDAIGFGFIPTSLDDARSTLPFHNLDISILKSIDIDYFKQAITRIWCRTLSYSDLEQTSSFCQEFSFFANIEIVDVLTNKRNLPNFRLLADMLYYMVKDMHYEV